MITVNHDPTRHFSIVVVHISNFHQTELVETYRTSVAD